MPKQQSILATKQKECFTTGSTQHGPAMKVTATGTTPETTLCFQRWRRRPEPSCIGIAGPVIVHLTLSARIWAAVKRWF
jgi:hypothetical protein